MRSWDMIGWGRYFAVIGCLSLSIHPLQAQQNLFNVPSAEITPQNSLFFQQQFNFNSSTKSNTTISAGLGHDFEIGMNVFDLVLIPERITPVNPASSQVLFNMQKAFELDEHFKLGLGTQIGQTTPEPNIGVRLANFSWLTGVSTLPAELGKVFVGAYFANETYRTGGGDPFGFMLGYDIPIIKDRFSLQGDYISGRSGMSVAVIGGVIQLSEKWQLSLGGQLPSPGSHNPYGAVMELTFVPGNERGKLE